MAALPNRSLMSVEEYLQLEHNSTDTRYEYIDGQEYVLVDSLRPTIEVYKREENNFWTYQAFELSNNVELASLGIQFPVADAYEYVTFPPDENDVETE